MHWLEHHAYLVLFFLVGQIDFNFGDLQSILLGYLQDLVTYLLAALQFIWNALLAAINYLIQVLNFVWQFLQRIVQDIRDALKWIWENVIKGALVRAIQLYQRIRAWLQKTFGPVIDFLKKVRAWYDWYFRTYVQPILRILQQFRRFLTIFRLLGFKWAARLDGDIAMIEQKITQAYTLLRGYINQAITWLDLIVDPSGILRRNPLFAALAQTAGGLRNLVLNSAIFPLSGSQIDTQARDRAQASKATQRTNYQTYYSQKQVTPDDNAFRAQFAQEFDSLRSGSSEPTF